MPSILIRGGHIYDPSSNVDIVGDIFIENGVILQIGQFSGDTSKCKVIDAENLHVFPAFIDAHVHFRTPGQEHKESFETGYRAALAGGFTTVIQMPNTSPPLSTPELVKRFTRDEPLRTRVFATITVNRQGRELNNLKMLSDTGAVGFSDDGSPVTADTIMEQALNESKKIGKRIVSHAENLSLSKDGVIIEGEVASKLGVKGIPREAESSMVKRDIELARKTGGHLHICHVSTRESVEIIKKAKRDGVDVTAEATPHHLLLNHEAVLTKGTNAKMNPPLAHEEDRVALVEALKKGIIDIIATDHAPHSTQEKMENLEKAPFGVIGLETAFPVLYSKLVVTGILPLEMLLRKMTSEPAKCFGLEFNNIRKGNEAYLALVDLNEEFRIDSKKFHSKGKNTPFNSWSVRGEIKYTVSKGIIRFPFQSNRISYL